MTDCVFCRIVKHEEDAERWAEQPGRWVAFTPLNPVTKGHVLVVPAEHQEWLDQLSPDSQQWLMFALASVGGRLNEAYNVIQSNGAAATQTIKHVHFHIVPRREGDGLMLPWSAPKEQ